VHKGEFSCHSTRYTGCLAKFLMIGEDATPEQVRVCALPSSHLSFSHVPSYVALAATATAPHALQVTARSDCTETFGNPIAAAREEVVDDCKAWFHRNNGLITTDFCTSVQNKMNVSKVAVYECDDVFNQMTWGKAMAKKMLVNQGLRANSTLAPPPAAPVVAANPQ
jgi:hypothetical protein